MRGLRADTAPRKAASSCLLCAGRSHLAADTKTAVFSTLLLLCVVQFLTAFSQVVVAGAVGTFYWCRADAENEEMRKPIRGAAVTDSSGSDSSRRGFRSGGSLVASHSLYTHILPPPPTCAMTDHARFSHPSPLIPPRIKSASFHRAWRYHLGSVALGSFIIALVQLFRLILEYVNRKTKQLQEKNLALKFLMCCARCCAWYLERVITYINRNAFIIVAVKGTSFCPSAWRAVGLIVSNALRLIAVNAIGDYLIWCGKIVTVLTGTMVAFAVRDLDSLSLPPAV